MDNNLLTQEPFKLFHEWYSQACDQAPDLHEPSSMAVATADKDGTPSVRILLLRGYDDRGFCFYTNLTSRKGRDISENPKAALCFYWDHTDRQIRVEGRVERLSEKEADLYFSKRERGSQIGAWASKQSCVMEQEHELPERIKATTEQFAGQAIPRPPFWSGYRLVPSHIEFWDKRPYRLHKRLLYTKQSGQWTSELLYP